MHQRTVIRRKVRDLLGAGLPSAIRVELSRVLALRKSELVAVSVYADDEEIAPASRTTAPRELERHLDLIVEALIAPAAGVDLHDAIDALDLRLDAVLHADPFLGGEASDSILTKNEQDTPQDGDRLVGWLRKTYDVRYFTLDPPPRDDLDDFLTAPTTYDLGGAAAADDIVVQELPDES